MKALLDTSGSFELGNSEDLQELRKYLIIAPPVEGEIGQALFSFSRTKEVDIKWSEVIAKGDTTKAYVFKSGTEQIRRFLEMHWGIEYRPDGTLDFTSVMDFGVNHVEDGSIRNFATTSNDGSIHGFYIVASRDGPFFKEDSKEHFLSPTAYEALWEAVDFVNLRIDSLSSLTVLDLTAALILRQFRRVREASGVGEILSENADKLITNSASVSVSPNDLSDMVSTYQRMKSPALENSEALSRLSEQASALGYSLGGSSGTELTQYGGQNAAWLPTFHKIRPDDIEYVSNGVGEVVHFRSRDDALRRENRAEKIIKTDRLISQKRDELKTQGYESYIFERIGGELLSQDGLTLESVLQSCALDVQFWEQCAVWIPGQREAANGERYIASYTIITRPFPGVTALRLPRIYVEEDLSIRGQQVKSELGELVYVLNLTPGEERTVSFESRSSRELELQTSLTSTREMNVETNFSVSNDFESELSRTAERAGSSNWNASISGSYFGFVSGSAGGGQTFSYSNKEFAKQVQNISSNAARKNVSNTKREISNSATAKITSSQKEFLEVKMKNVNEGRTLNLAFYNIYNKRSIGTYLNGINFVVDTGIELIEGSGLTKYRYFTLSDISGVLEACELEDEYSKGATSRYPVRNNDTNAKETLRKNLVDAIIKVLEEYDSSNPDASGVITIANLQTIKGMADHKDKIKALEAAIRDVTIKDEKPIIEPASMIVGAAGLYVDSFIGARSGTEPYAEWMRLTEVQKRESDIELDLAKARQISAHSLPNSVLNQNSLTVMPLSSSKLEFNFTEPVQAGDWLILVDGSLAGVKLTTNATDLKYEVDFGEDKSWLSADEINYGIIVHETLRNSYYFIV